MPLIDLKTNLKSLKYGNDRPGGGDSGQPYIKKPLYADPNKIPVGNGVVLASIHTLEDISRLTKMFFDIKSPHGFLFTINQNLLSRTGVKTQASGLLNGGIYLPTSTIAQAGVSATGLHFNKQGINPVPGTFGSLPTYSDKVKNDQDKDENRLVNFYDNRVLSITEGDIWSYSGGPCSVLGVGPTRIRFADQRTGINNRNYKYPFFTGTAPRDVNRDETYFSLGENIQIPASPYDQFLRFTRYGSFTVSNIYEDNQKLIYDKIQEFTNIGRTQHGGKTGIVTVGINDNALSYSEINEMAISSSARPGDILDFRTILRNNINLNTLTKEKSTIISDAPDYSDQNIEARVNIGGKNKQGPGYKAGKNLYSYESGSGIGPIDRLNAYPIYKSSGVRQNKDAPINDLVKFRIAYIDGGKPENKNFIHFRAFLDSFSDNYTANWNQHNYVGRGETFYTYDKFTRNISLGWTVAAQSVEELTPMYTKLNYLASTLTPQYSENGYMRGPLVQLTVGGYLYEQVGFITQLSYTIDENTPWEIGITNKGIKDFKYNTNVKELPHYIKVSSFQFTPIHNFNPSVQDLTFDKGNIITNGYGKQRYIALSDAESGNNLYDGYENKYPST